MKKEGGKLRENWLKEIARDLIALGSVPFFALVLIRVKLLDNPVYMGQFIIAGIAFIGLMYWLKANLYAGFGFIVLFFTSNHYKDIQFTIFASILYLLLIASLFYLKYEKKEIVKGIIFGAVSILAEYYVVNVYLGG